jgi:hypothetical protein
VVKLPNQQLDRKEYLEVKKKLELIGGKWKGGKIQGFEFKCVWKKADAALFLKGRLFFHHVNGEIAIANAGRLHV